MSHTVYHSAGCFLYSSHNTQSQLRSPELRLIAQFAPQQRPSGPKWGDILQASLTAPMKVESPSRDTLAVERGISSSNWSPTSSFTIPEGCKCILQTLNSHFPFSPATNSYHTYPTTDTHLQPLHRPTRLRAWLKCKIRWLTFRNTCYTKGEHSWT